MAEKFDLIVAGGGVIGLTLAALVQQRWGKQRQVIVVDAQASPALLGNDISTLRVSAMAPASIELFQRLDVWDAPLSAAAQSYRRMTVWDSRSSATANDALHFDATDLGAPSLGSIVENDRLRYALWMRCAELGVELRSGTTIDALRLTAESAFVQGDSLDIQAPLVVGADGANSRVRTLAGFDIALRDYDQHALVTHVVSTKAHDSTAWQQFNPEGPLALLPLADGRSSVVYSADSGAFEQTKTLNDDALGALLTERSGNVLGALKVSAPRAGFRLQAARTAGTVQRRCALIGDAAQRVHPLAGQGANLGLADARAMAEFLLEAGASSADIGDEWLLERYQRRRKLAITAAMTALDTLHRLFKSRNSPTIWLRRAGLGLVDRSHQAKVVMARRAMGL